jgi:hypothetical protein
VSGSLPLQGRDPEHAFLDANVIRGQLTTDILLTLAEQSILEPFWSQSVMDEMRRNRPAGVAEQKVDRRITTMNEYFPDALIVGYDHLIAEMQADAKDRHVLAAAVHSRSDVLVTDNVSDFRPPSTGPYAIRVERLSQFLNRKLDERPERVMSALQSMVDRNQRDPRTLAALIDKMASQSELRGFAQRLNELVQTEHRGHHEALAMDHKASRPQKQATASVAFDGIAPAEGAVNNAPKNAPRGRRSDSARAGQDREPDR